ncbi:MAG TPA: peroxiredoxin family protein [Steroidobacteraceae bacterium]|jgi:peroxiredoxin
MSLQQKLDVLRDHLQVRTRSDALVAMLRVMEDAVSSDRAIKALQAAGRAPAFTLPDERDKPVSLADTLNDGPVVMVFYRGDWCPWCTQELAALQAVAGQFEQLGASVLAVSPQKSLHNRRCVRKHKLGFPILHDAGGHVAAQYGVNWDIPANLRKLYLGLNVDLTKFNGDEDWTLPLPARYLIDQKQSVVYAEINASESHRMNPAGLLTALESLQRKAPPH